MAQNRTVHLEATHVRAPVYLEATWISPNEPSRAPLAPLPGGGGPGYGGWGLDTGRPRGTVGPNRFHQGKGWRTVFGEEHKAVQNSHAEQYLPALQQLPAQIAAERAAIVQQANAAGATASQRVQLLQQLTTANLQQKRADYLQTLPVATGFYGAIPFYKRYDSFATRLNDQGAFGTSASAEEWGRRVWESFNASVEAAYRLHIAAQKFQALAANLPELARQVDEAELAQPDVDLPKAIGRRTTQVLHEQQICFDCLPNFVGHQLIQSTPAQETDTLAQRLSAYASAANALIATKKAEVPAFSDSNPSIVGPLSKPQSEALQHLVDEQATRRAGNLWADYHRALSLAESIRHLQWFSAAMANLAHRALEVEQLRARQASGQAADEQARQTAQRAAEEAARRTAAEEDAARQREEARRKAHEAALARQNKPKVIQALERPMAERLAKKARQQAEAERRAKEAADKAEARRLARVEAENAKAQARATRTAQRLETERKAKQAIEAARAERAAQKAARLAAAERRDEEGRKKHQAEVERKERERLRTTYASAGTVSASLPLVEPIGPSTFGIPQQAYEALQAAIRAAVTRALSGSALTMLGTVAMAWPSSLANSDRHYLISIPLKDLSPPGGPDLEAIARSSASVDLPYLLAGSEHDDDLDLYLLPGSKPVAVRAARFDAQRQVYTLTLHKQKRILTWTPAIAPGSELGSSTSLPAVPPGTVVYTGSGLNPVISETEGYPALDLLDQERVIITFPMDSGLPPILVVFKSPRSEPGVAGGVGTQVTGRWLGEAARGEGAPIPTQIADLLRGIEFRNYYAFREKLWKTVANDPELSKQFSKQSITRMRENGHAPKARTPDHYGKKKSFELHHVVPIKEGGAVYDMDNMRVVTPTAHHRIHYGDKS